MSAASSTNVRQEAQRPALLYDALLRILSGSAVSPRPIVGVCGTHEHGQVAVSSSQAVSPPATSGTGGYNHVIEGTEPASLNLRIMLRTRWFGMSDVLSSLAPVFGEMSLMRSHSVMAARS